MRETCIFFVIFTSLLSSPPPPPSSSFFLWWLRGKVPASCSGGYKIESRLARHLSISGLFPLWSVTVLVGQNLDVEHIYCWFNLFFLLLCFIAGAVIAIFLSCRELLRKRVAKGNFFYSLLLLLTTRSAVAAAAAILSCFRLARLLTSYKKTHTDISVAYVNSLWQELEPASASAKKTKKKIFRVFCIASNLWRRRREKFWVACVSVLYHVRPCVQWLKLRCCCCSSSSN